jgi:hypothetical protein
MYWFRLQIEWDYKRKTYLGAEWLDPTWAHCTSPRWQIRETDHLMEWWLEGESEALWPHPASVSVYETSHENWPVTAPCPYYGMLHEQPVRHHCPLPTTFCVIFYQYKGSHTALLATCRVLQTCRNIGLYAIACNTWRAPLQKCSGSPQILQCWTRQSRSISRHSKMWSARRR